MTVRIINDFTVTDIRSVGGLEYADYILCLDKPSRQRL